LSGVRKLAKGAVWPVRRLLDPRFADIQRRIDWSRDRVVDESRELERRQERLQDELANLIGTFGAASNESLAFLGRQIREFEGSLQDLTARLDELGTRVQSVEETMGDVYYARRIESISDTGIGALDANTAAFLNYSEGHRGFAAQRHLWTNPPLTLEYLTGDVRLGSVNERIVEIPYAFRALGSLAIPARVLDVGSVESTIPLSLAGLGYQVTALDLRAYPFTHPNLEVAVSRLEDFDREPGSYDAVLCISTVEHVGLGWYGEARQSPDADRQAVQRMGELLKPRGILVLTVPFGKAGVDAVQRTYDDAMLDALVAGFEIESREIVRQRDDATWAPGEAVDPDARAVAMVTARRPA
jgi:SAM-dependent methyltransferase